jgi:hypothetical protein
MVSRAGGKTIDFQHQNQSRLEAVRRENKTGAGLK